MSQSHPQNQNSTSKPDNTDASKVNSDHDETQASKENTPALNNKERVPSPTPQSAQASHLPSSQSLPTTKSTNLSGQSSPEHCSSSVPAPNHDANEAPRLLDKASDMPNDRNSQGDRYQSPPPPQEPEPDLGSSKEPLEAYHWDELEQRFYTEMTGCEEVEKGIQSDFDKLLEVFKTWTAIGSHYEEDRGSKRLRTRMAFVHQSEQSLEAKRLHYIKCVKAFESALALLSDP